MDGELRQAGPNRRKILPEIQNEADRQALERADVTSLDAIWDRIGRDSGIRDFVQETGIDRARLVRDLTSVASRKALEKGTSWSRRHALDLLLLAASTLVIVLAVRAVPHAQAVGIALRDLRPGDALSAGILHGPADFDPPRRLKRAVQAGGYVLPEWLEPIPKLGGKDLQGRYRLSLKLRSEQAKLLPSLPSIVTLGISSPGGEGKTTGTLLLYDLPALSLEKPGDAAQLVAALTQDQLAEILPLLPDGEVYVLQPAHGGLAK